MWFGCVCSCFGIWSCSIWFWLYFSQGQCVNVYMCLWWKNLLPIMWCYQGFKRGFVFCFWQQLFSCTVPVVFLSIERAGGDRRRVAMWGGMIQYGRGGGSRVVLPGVLVPAVTWFCYLIHTFSYYCQFGAVYLQSVFEQRASEKNLEDLDHRFLIMILSFILELNYCISLIITSKT